jgi:hypothetical protein
VVLSYRPPLFNSFFLKLANAWGDHLMDIMKQLSEMAIVFLVSTIFIVGMALCYNLILFKKEERKHKKEEDLFYKKFKK